ncbi:MAG TPA: proteasome activator [Acidimicrobiales bacterium]|nr:proteasome activator [Acidimicrobiales bacterium]
MTSENGADEPSDDGSVVSNPAALIRVANMLQMLTIEVHELPLDDAGRRRLFDVQHRAVDAIRSLVSDDLGAELSSLGLPLEDVGASESELRIAQAQIVGWLNGLFQGIQAAMFARQMVSVEQLQELQRQLGRGSQPTPPGQYL